MSQWAEVRHLQCGGGCAEEGDRSAVEVGCQDGAAAIGRPTPPVRVSPPQPAEDGGQAEGGLRSSGSNRCSTASSRRSATLGASWTASSWTMELERGDEHPVAVLTASYRWP